MASIALGRLGTNKLKIKKPRAAAKLEMAEMARAIPRSKHCAGKAASQPPQFRTPAFVLLRRGRQAASLEYDCLRVIRRFYQMTAKGYS
jgi:hypothetical protein